MGNETRIPKLLVGHGQCSFSPFASASLRVIDEGGWRLYLARMTAVEERRIKMLLKDAVVEVLTERHDLLRDALRESLEDVAILRAIREGEKTRLINRQKVLRRLSRGA